MDVANATALLGPHPLSAPEVMGLSGFADLRAAAAAVVAAARKICRHRGVLGSETVAALEALETSVVEHVGGALDGLAVDRGVPGPHESLTIGVDRDYEETATGCWRWLRSFDGRGMPYVGRRTGGSENLAPRIYWTVKYDQRIPDGMIVERLCGNQSCVRPEHGTLVSRAEVLRRRGKLTWSDVNEIRNAVAAGARASDLAARFAVSERNIRDIVGGTIWKDPNYIPGCPLEGGSIVPRSRTTVRARVGDYRVDPGPDCWVWLGALHGAAPVITAGPLKGVTAARAYYVAAGGRVPAGKAVGRTCGNELCVHPHHAVVVARGKRTTSRRASRRAARFRLEHAPLLEQAVREAAAVREQKAGLWFARSIDAPLAEGGEGTLADVAPAKDALDPFEEIRRRELHSIVGDLDEDTIARLPDDVLLDLRERLLAAGHVPSTSMAMA